MVWFAVKTDRRVSIYYHLKTLAQIGRYRSPHRGLKKISAVSTVKLEIAGVEKSRATGQNPMLKAEPYAETESFTDFTFAIAGLNSRVAKKESITMTTPIIAQQSPYAVEVEEGKTYFWCACGKSNNQPFCDGSHKDTGITPVKYAADASKRVFFCGCKHSSNQPLCDGSHSKL